MYHALDQNGQLVSADQAALRSRHRRYKCPCCGKPVSVRVGQRIDPYFAHLQGQANPECEEYHLGRGSNGEGSIQRRVPAAVPMYVAITANHGRASWVIQLALPKSPTDHGFIRIPDAKPALPDISCRSLSAGRRVTVKPKAEAYRLETRNVGEPIYETRLRTPIAGLRSVHGTVFAYSGVGGRRLTAGSPLYWGRGYIVVWPQQLSPHFPAGVWTTALENQPGWRCALIELPAEPSPDVDRWADRFLNRVVATPRFELVVLAPIHFGERQDRLISLQCENYAVVAVTGEPGTPPPLDISVADRSVLGISSELPIFLRVQVTKDRPTSIFLLGENDEDEWLLQGSTPEPGAVAAVEIVVGRRSQSGPHAIPVFSSDAADHLLDLAAHRAELVDLHLPPQGRASFGNSASALRVSWNWKDTRSVNEEVVSAGEARTTLMTAITQSLDRKEGFWLDFGNFGAVEFIPPLPMVNQLRLTPQLRQRIAWLKQTTTSPCYISDVPISLRGIAELFHTQDRPLVKDLFSARQWPPHVVPHVQEATAIIIHLARRGQKWQLQC